MTLKNSENNGTEEIGLVTPPLFQNGALLGMGRRCILGFVTLSCSPGLCVKACTVEDL